ncbi:MAG: glycosyltransferase [Verrucomicrobiales bacterium]|nr:glycosyltransferase [Verrucomicrobiales bacterium]
MPDYAIIIPAFNEEAYLAVTLEATRSAMAEQDLSGVLIVVDNNSSDTTAAVAEKNGADRVVFEPHNQIARARNAGAEAVPEVQFLVFVDADTLITAELLAIALKNLQSGRIAAGGAGVVMDQKVSPIVDLITIVWNKASVLFNYAAGSFFYTRRDAYEAAGGFDETVYAGEEIWLAKRIKRRARKEKMRFVVISDPPVVTSGRKSEWFSTGQFIWQLTIIAFCPWAMRNRKFCQLWYRRPEE